MDIDDYIKILKTKPLSGSEVANLVDGQTKIVRYSEICEYSKIEDILYPYNTFILLYEIKPRYGHWVCVILHPNNVLEFFDPYGYSVDEQLFFIDEVFRRQTNQDEPYLLKLFLKSKYKLIYNKTKPNGEPTPASINIVRDEPIFRGYPKDWHLSVVRFSIPTAFIPIKYIPINYDSKTPTNINKTAYSFTLSYNGNDFQEYVQWVTQDKVADPLPPPPTIGSTSSYDYIRYGNQQFLNYYSLYSIQHFVKILNTTLANCFTNNILPLLPGPVLNTYKAPYFVFDPVTRLFSLKTTSIFLENQAIPVKLYMNALLYLSFDNSFDFEYFKYDASDGKVSKFTILDRNDNVEDVGGGLMEYTQQQEYDSTGTLSSFNSLIIRSGSLPILSEGITLQANDGTRTSDIISGESINIISDFEVDLASMYNYRASLHYNPSAEYRRITMVGEQPLTSFDLSIYWRDNYDNLYPILIPDHGQATVKILFEEK